MRSKAVIAKAEAAFIARSLAKSDSVAFANSIVPYLIELLSIIPIYGCMQGVLWLTVPRLNPAYISLGAWMSMIPHSCIFTSYVELYL